MKTGEWRSNISLKGVNKNISGQITIFSAVILLSVLTLAGVLVDISRISAGKAMVKRAAGSAARSLLAGYGSRLKEDYGIFAIPGTENEELKDLFEEYLSAGLSIPGSEENINADAEDRTDLFGFRIEKISVTPMYNLSENKATKRQILEYMKYRAPAGLAESFVERLKAIKDVGKMSAAYKQKVGIDKILGSMDKSQQNLKKSVDGMGNPEDIFINGFNQEGSWERIYDEYNSTADKLASIREKLADLEGGGTDGKADSDLDGTGSDSADGGASRPGNATEDRPEAEKSALEQARSEAESLLKELWSQLRNSLTRDYIKVNDTAAAEIEKIAEKGIEAVNAIESLKSYMDKNFGGEEGAFSTDFNEQTRTELEKLKELILDGRRAGEILNSVNKNSSLLKNIISKLDGADAGGGHGAHVQAALHPQVKIFCLHADGIANARQQNGGKFLQGGANAELSHKGALKQFDIRLHGVVPHQEDHQPAHGKGQDHGKDGPQAFTPHFRQLWHLRHPPSSACPAFQYPRCSRQTRRRSFPPAGRRCGRTAPESRPGRR